MSKGAVLILDDDVTVREGFRYKFEDDNELDLDLIECSSYDDYQKIIGNPQEKGRIKAFILDLANSTFETENQSFKAAEYIQDQYQNNRVPIFIHSANIAHYSELDDKGTVFKINKDTDSTVNIMDSIRLMNEAGFLDIFCYEGSLQNKIMEEIHKAFTEQFKGLEIESIIKSIKTGSNDNFRERTIEVFERLAIRAVFQNFVSNRKEDEVDIKINAIEHFYRRQGLPFFTGDIFEHKESKQLIFLATPRCNIANNNFEQLLICEINEINEEQIKAFTKEKQDAGLNTFRRSITDDVTNAFIAERYRFLPISPQFRGGFVDYKKVRSINQQEFESNFKYYISLVDDLTNDVIRKLASYLLRGGISDTHYPEAHQYLKDIIEQKKT